MQLKKSGRIRLSLRILNGRKSASATIVLGKRRYAFNTITYSAAEFRNPKIIRIKVECFLFMFTFQLAASFFKFIKRSIEPFSFHVFCTFYLKFSCRSYVAIAKV